MSVPVSTAGLGRSTKKEQGAPAVSTPGAPSPRGGGEI